MVEGDSFKAFGEDPASVGKHSLWKIGMVPTFLSWAALFCGMYYVSLLARRARTCGRKQEYSETQRSDWIDSGSFGDGSDWTPNPLLLNPRLDPGALIKS